MDNVIQYFKDLFESIPDYGKMYFYCFYLKTILIFNRIWLFKK